VGRLVLLGKVVRAVGLRGHLGVAGPEEPLQTLAEVALRQGGGEPERRRVLEARRQGRLWAVRIEGVDDRSGAEALIGAEVLVEREALGDAGAGRHYWADLEGLPVTTVTGEDIGKVTGLYETGGVDVLVVTGERGEKLVPLAPYVEVDLAGGRVVVDPPPGLLDGEEEAGSKEGGPETRDRPWRGSRSRS
jgi:16S rRNA processing protein RimM